MPNINGNSKITPDFGDAERLRLIVAVQRSSIESMSLRPGFRVLDVGCGRGSGTLALAAAVGATGAVRGVDYDAMRIAEARQRPLRDGVDADPACCWQQSLASTADKDGRYASANFLVIAGSKS